MLLGGNGCRLTLKGGLQFPRLVIWYVCTGKYIRQILKLMLFYINIDAQEDIRENHRHHR